MSNSWAWNDQQKRREENMINTLMAIVVVVVIAIGIHIGGTYSGFKVIQFDFDLFGICFMLDLIKVNGFSQQGLQQVEQQLVVILLVCDVFVEALDGGSDRWIERESHRERFRLGGDEGSGDIMRNHEGLPF